MRLSNSNTFAVGTTFSSITFTGASGGYTLNGNAIDIGIRISGEHATGITAINSLSPVGSSRWSPTPVRK